MAGDLLTIGAVAERAGIAASALRYYDREGIVPSVRSPGGQRRYPRSSLRRIAFIRAAQNVGLSLDEIRDALAALPAGPVAQRGRLGAPVGIVARAARRADRGARGAARPPRLVHRLRVPVARRLRPHEPGRRRGAERIGRALPARAAAAPPRRAGGR